MTKIKFIERYGEEEYQKRLEYVRKYREQHKDEINQYNKQHYQQHREEKKQYQKQYREQHREEKKQWFRNNRNMFAYCIPEQIEQIENYWLAKESNFDGWHIHHRLETHNSDGEKRLVNLSREELIALDMYYNRPANELVFLTISEHMKLHKMKSVVLFT